MEKLICGMRMDFNESEKLPQEEFVRIHQLQPYYVGMADKNKKVFVKELKAVHKEMSK